MPLEPRAGSSPAYAFWNAVADTGIPVEFDCIPISTVPSGARITSRAWSHSLPPRHVEYSMRYLGWAALPHGTHVRDYVDDDAYHLQLSVWTRPDRRPAWSSAAAWSSDGVSVEVVAGSWQTLIARGGR